MTEETAGTPLYPPQKGTRTLTAPDGRQWQAESGLMAAAKEQRERIPPEVRLRRIHEALAPTDDELRIEALEREVAALTTQRDELQRDKRVYAQAWRNDALEAAAKIVHRYEGNQHCVDDILALRQSIPTNGTEGLRAELDAAKRALAEMIERCARVCEQQITNEVKHGRLQAESVLSRCAAAIRKEKLK